MELIGVWITITVDPGSFIEAHDVDHKAVTVPVPDRMASPGWSQLISLRMRPPIHIDVAPDVCATFVNDENTLLLRQLNELEWKWRCHRAGSAGRETVSFRIIFG